MCLHVDTYKNMLAVCVLTMGINGSVQTSGSIQLPKRWCHFKYFRSLRHVAGTYNTGETHVLWDGGRPDRAPSQSSACAGHWCV